MTDNEIIKVLGEMSAEYEENFSKHTLDLINRQKSEIERLRQKIKEIYEHFSEGEFGKGMAIVINLEKEMNEDSN